MTDARRPEAGRSRPSSRPEAAAAGGVGDAGTMDAEVVEAEVVDEPGGFGTGAGAAGEAAAAGNDAGAPRQSRPAPDAGTDAAPSDADLEEAADRVEGDLSMLVAEREQFLNAYQRAQADFENYRRQTQKRQDDAVQRALGGFVERLLPVLDSCDAAMAHGAGEAVEPLLAALYGALEKEGLERIDPAGKPFDPAEAEAVIHEPGSGGEQVVAEVMRAGYRWRGRVLRPAMVKVTD